MALIGGHPSIVRVRQQIARLAPTPLTVLVQGPTGSGKEVVARELHEASGRAGAFVPVDCGAISPNLVESTLFGHERGAFTGADRARSGLVHAAKGGTFFLDEVGELPMESQTRLLRLLENQTYRPVGGGEERLADVRVIAATWRDLPQRVAEGAFREDLFHRLALGQIALPPVAERGDDVVALFQHFLSGNWPSDRPTPTLEPTLVVWLRRWSWPGNVREIRNAAMVAAALCEDGQVGIDHLPGHLSEALPIARPHRDPVELYLDLPYMQARRLFLDAFQLRYVEAQLRASDGNVSAAARASGMDRRSIQRILARRGDSNDG